MLLPGRLASLGALRAVLRLSFGTLFLIASFVPVRTESFVHLVFRGRPRGNLGSLTLVFPLRSPSSGIGSGTW